MRILLGCFIIFLSVMTAWFSQLQHRVEDFRAAEEVDATIEQDGYVSFYGSVEYGGLVDCPDSEVQCIYVQEEVYEFVEAQEVVCGDLNQYDENMRVLEQIDDQCDEHGCEPCYQVARTSWEKQSEQVSAADVTVGAYTIKLSEDTLFVDEQSATIRYYEDPMDLSDLSKEYPDAVGDIRYEYSFAQISDSLLIVGLAHDGVVKSGGDRYFIVSPHGYDETERLLGEQDSAAKWGLRFGSLIFMVLGFVIAASQFAAPIAGVLRAIPFFGGGLNRGLQGIVYLAVGVVAALVWVIMISLFIVLDSIWLSLLALIVLVSAIVLIVRAKAQKK